MAWAFFISFTAFTAGTFTQTIYDSREMTEAWRAAVASFIAVIVYILTVLQKNRSQRPTWDSVLARALLTGIFALVAVLIVRNVSDNLAVEWLTAAVIGSEGPAAVRRLRERLGLIWRDTGGEK